MYLHENKELETSLVSYSFPTEFRRVGNLVYNYLSIDNIDIIDEFYLTPFDMRVQSLNRTFIDKIFALCDYYMEGKSKRYSRHLYDLCKLRPLVPIDDDLQTLVSEVREHRSILSICPSAKTGINIKEIIYEFCNNDFYKVDYDNITDYFTSDIISYEDTIHNIIEIADELFREG